MPELGRCRSVGVILAYSGRPKEGLVALKTCIRLDPRAPSLVPCRWLAGALGELGQTAEAKEVLEKAIAVSPASFDFQVRERPPWFRPEDHAHMLDGPRKAGW